MTAKEIRQKHSGMYTLRLMSGGVVEGDLRDGRDLGLGGRTITCRRLTAVMDMLK